MAHSASHGGRFPSPGGYPHHYPHSAWMPVEAAETAAPRPRPRAPRPAPRPRQPGMAAQPHFHDFPGPQAQDRSWTMPEQQVSGDSTTDMQRSLLALAGSLMAQYMVKKQGSQQKQKSQPPSLLEMPLQHPAAKKSAGRGHARGIPGNPQSASVGAGRGMGRGRGSALNINLPGAYPRDPRGSYSSFAGKVPGHIPPSPQGAHEYDYQDYNPSQSWAEQSYSEYAYQQAYAPQYEGGYASDFNHRPTDQEKVQKKPQPRGKAGWPMKTSSDASGQKPTYERKNKPENKYGDSRSKTKSGGSMSREKLMADEWNQGIQQMIREATELAALAMREEQGHGANKSLQQKKSKGFQTNLQQKQKTKEGLPFKCELCSVNSHSAEQLAMHFNGRKHAQKYLAKQNELGFEEFDRWYKRIPFPRKMEEGMTFVPNEMWDCAAADPTAQWGRFIEYVLRSGQLNSLTCKVCLTECMTMSNWWSHLMGQKHLQNCRELADTIGWAKYNLEYGDIPVIDSAAVQGHGDWGSPEAAYQWYHTGMPSGDARPSYPVGRFGKGGSPGPASYPPSEHQQGMMALRKLLPHVNDRHLSRALNDLQYGVSPAPADYSVAMQVQQMSYSDLDQTAQVVHVLRSLDPSLVHQLAQTNPGLLQGMFSGFVRQQPRRPPQTKSQGQQGQAKKKQTPQQKTPKPHPNKTQKNENQSQNKQSDNKTKDEKDAKKSVDKDQNDAKKKARGRRGGKKNKKEIEQKKRTAVDSTEEDGTKVKEILDETDKKSEAASGAEEQEGASGEASLSEASEDSGSEGESEKDTPETKDSETVSATETN